MAYNSSKVVIQELGNYLFLKTKLRTLINLFYNVERNFTKALPLKKFKDEVYLFI